MIKYLIISLLFISSLLNGQLTNRFTSNSVKPILSHEQEYYISEDFSIGDYVGVFQALYTVIDTSTQTIWFQLIDDGSGKYDIDSASGLITLESVLSSGTDIILVKVYNGTQSNTYNATIYVSTHSNSVFIDPSAGTDGDGLKATPYNTWGSVTFVAGKSYFQKRGTTESTEISILVDGTISSPIILGAYSTGNKPILTGTYYNIWIWGDYTYVNNFRIVSSRGVRIENNSFHNKILHLDISKIVSGDNGAIYLKDITGNYKSYNYISDTEIDTVGIDIHGIKSSTGGTIENVWCNYKMTSGTSNGITCGDSSIIRFCLTEDFNTSGIQPRAANTIVEYNICKDNYEGIYINRSLVGGTANTIIANNISHGNTYGIDLDGVVTANCDSLLVVNNEIYDNSYGIFIYGKSSYNKIGYNIIYDNSICGLAFNAAGPQNYDTVYYNLIYSNPTDGVRLSSSAGGTGNAFINNTIIKSGATYDLDNGSAYSISLINCIYQTKTATGWNITTSYDYDSGDPFVNYAADDFQLDSNTAPVDAGTMINIDYLALNENPIYNNTVDIGAYEYFYYNTSSANWDTLKINLTASGYEVGGWNNIVDLSKNDSTILYSEDDSLTSSYFVIINDSLINVSTAGIGYSPVSLLPDLVAQRSWYWHDDTTQQFRISNIDYGYYNIGIYGSKAASSIEMSTSTKLLPTGDSVIYDVNQNENIYWINQVNYSSGDFILEITKYDSYSHINAIIIQRTEATNLIRLKLEGIKLRNTLGQKINIYNIP